MLHEFVTSNREEIIHRCREKVAKRSIPPATAAEIDHGVPLFLEQLVDALRLGLPSTAAIGTSAGLHGHDLLLQGFTVSQVVHDYGDVCQSITEMAIELETPISATDFHALNACLDDAIARAVTEHTGERTHPGIDGETGRLSQQVGFTNHELRNLLNTAILAFEVLKSGKVGVGGSTGKVMHRSLVAARDLIARSLNDVVLTKGAQQRERFPVDRFIDEAASAAMLAATALGIKLKVERVEQGVLVDADRQVLAAVLMNLLQNAFKFTRAGTTVILRVRAGPDRVLLEVQDECGGLPGGDQNDLFRLFEQRSANRTGLGLGLAFSRNAIEAQGGRIYARNLPGVGCVFTVNLPRILVPIMVV
jgi:signal transduction histidine kinase